MSKKAPAVFLTLTCFLALFGLGIYALAANSNKEASSMPETVVSLAVAADLHYISPSLTDHGEYFENMIRNSDGKVMDYIEELTDAFIDEVAAARPDALILAGDITFNGARRSHEDLAAKLLRLKGAGVRVLVMPGNHDLENRNAASFSGDGFTRVESVTADEFSEIYAELGFSEALSRDGASLSYTYELTPALRVLMLDVNTADSPNAVKPETLVWAEAQLRDAAAAGARLIAVSHQNLLQHNSVIVDGYRMGGSADVLSLYERFGVIANFTGHLHCQHIAQSEDGFYEIATSALSVSPNQYGVVTLSDGLLRYETRQTDVAAWARNSGSDDPSLLDFAAYSRNFFLGSGDEQANEAVDGAPDADALEEFFGRLNAAYFSGRMDLIDPDDPMFDRWQALGGFTAVYIASIRRDAGLDSTHIDIAY